MIPSEIKLKRSLFLHETRSVFVIMAYAALLLTSSCSSVCSRKEDVSAILVQENEVLMRLKVERADSRVSTKVQADTDLSAAEDHLSRAIDDLIESNNAVNAAL